MPATLPGVRETVVWVGPIAPMLDQGITAVAADLGGVELRHVTRWERLSWSVATHPDAFVFAGIAEPEDREQAYRLSAQYPDARLILCETDSADYSVMRGGRSTEGGLFTIAALRDVLRRAAALTG